MQLLLRLASPCLTGNNTGKTQSHVAQNHWVCLIWNDWTSVMWMHRKRHFLENTGIQLWTRLCSRRVCCGEKDPSLVTLSYNGLNITLCVFMNFCIYLFSCLFQAVMKFPADYPYSPPSVRFMSKMWHPNVYEVCDCKYAVISCLAVYCRIYCDLWRLCFWCITVGCFLFLRCFDQSLLDDRKDIVP